MTDDTDWPPIIDDVQALTRNLLLTPLAPDAEGHHWILNVTRTLLGQMSDEDTTAAVREWVRVQTAMGYRFTVEDVLDMEAGA